MVERRQPTPAQIKAVANPLRLRILRLCNDREWTNKELADRLERDPATMLRHLRLLVEADLIEPVAVRQGTSGAYEKPYRSTQTSWHLSFETAAEDEEGEIAMLSAFRQELREAGNESIVDFTRFHLHLEEGAITEFSQRFLELVDAFRADDDERRDQGVPGYGGVMVLHRLADDPTPDAGT